MTAATLRMDLHHTRARTSWTMSLSFVAHALLVLWLALHPVKAVDMTPITEITLLDPGDLAPSSPALERGFRAIRTPRRVSSFRGSSTRTTSTSSASGSNIRSNSVRPGFAAS